MNQQDNNATLPRLQDPAAIDRLVKLMIKFGWPPPGWASQPDDLDAGQLDAEAA
jgi:hypothetical protein